MSVLHQAKTRRGYWNAWVEQLMGLPAAIAPSDRRAHLCRVLWLGGCHGNLRYNYLHTFARCICATDPWTATTKCGCVYGGLVASSNGL